jgi:hypothetical protein
MSLIAHIPLEYSSCVLKTVVFSFVSRISAFAGSHAVYLGDLKCYFDSACRFMSSVRVVYDC